MRPTVLVLTVVAAVALGVTAFSGGLDLAPRLTQGVQEAPAATGGATGCLTPEPGQPSAGRWIDLAPLTAPRQEVAVAALNGRVFVVGGFTGTGGTSDAVEAYDPSTDSWARVGPIPTPLHHAAAATVDGRLFVIGGMGGQQSAPTATTIEYDAASNAWVARAPMPTARGALGVAAMDGKIYAAGGSPGRNERDFAVYDPAADRWTALPPMPTARNHLAAAAIGGRFYAVGGRSGSIGGITGALEAYDPATDTWTPLAPMPTPRGGIAAAALGGCLYVFGGEGNQFHPLGIFDQVEVYDPATDSWRRLDPMGVARHGIGAAVAGTRVYVPGGATVQGFGATAIHQAYELGGP